MTSLSISILSVSCIIAQASLFAHEAPPATPSPQSAVPAQSREGKADMALPSEHLYPVMWHDGAGGEGPRAWVWCGDALRCVSVSFADPRDEMAYRELSFRVKWQAQDPDFADQYTAPPVVCFCGHFETGADAWNRPLLRVSNWFVMPPFFRLNAEEEVAIDYAESEKRMHLDASDFDRMGLDQELRGVSLQKYVKSSGADAAFTYPVVDADPSAQTVTLLTHRSTESTSGEGLEPVCLTERLEFADKAQGERFFSEWNVRRVKCARSTNGGVALMLTGIRDPKAGSMRGLRFEEGDALAAVPAAPAPSLNERLLVAARAGDAAAARRLLANGADVSASDRYLGETPLHRAAGGGHAEVVRLLLAAGADAEAKDALGETPLHWAAARALVCVDAPNSREARAAAEQGANPGESADVAGYVESVRLLLAAGADVNASDRKGRMPLHRAAAVGYANVLRELIAQGADVNARTRPGYATLSAGPESALETASRFRRADCEQLLKEAGARPNAKKR